PRARPGRGASRAACPSRASGCSVRPLRALRALRAAPDPLAARPARGGHASAPCEFDRAPPDAIQEGGRRFRGGRAPRVRRMRMNKKPVPGSWSRLALFGTMALAGSGCDLKTKAWAEQVLPAHPEGTLSVVEPWVELTLAYNHGTAFSVVPNMGSGTFLFGVFALILAAGLLATILFTRVGRLEALALGTIAGGGIGNGIERLAGTGVVDFIKVNYPWGGS